MKIRYSYAFILLMTIAAAMLSLISCGNKADPSASSSKKQSQTTTASAVTTGQQQTTQPETTTKSAKKTTTTAAVTTVQKTTSADVAEAYVEYHFRSKKQLQQHFEKHGDEFSDDFGYKNAAEYEKGASDVINNKSALYKTEAEDGDGVYYIEDTNEFVILSTDGYIRTYFRPNGGKSYFDRQ